MQPFSFQQTEISGLIVIQPFIAPDKRGYLMKSFERNVFAEHGIDLTPHEEITSCSQKGVLRGLHFQREHCQDKLVRVLHGAVYDVAVDLRRDSLTFGMWRGFTLSAQNQTMLYIPKGFAHGFLALEEGSVMNYLLGAQYVKEADGGIVWNDPELAICWPVEQVDELLIAEKDRMLPSFSTFRAAWGGLPCKVGVTS